MGLISIIDTASCSSADKKLHRHTFRQVVTVQRMMAMMQLPELQNYLSTASSSTINEYFSGSANT